MKRAIIIVLDSVGIGELPDAADYKDTGSNTLLNIKHAIPSMALKNMNALGLSSIDGGKALSDCSVENPSGAFGKLLEASKGKDTTTGHWEIAGIIIKKPFPTYPDGFPRSLIDEFEQKIGRKTMGNCVASGTEIITRLGEEHVSTGYPIVYTSADSVFQIAMHEDVISLDEQYRISQIARDMLTGEHNVSRVITRPFTGSHGNYKRTTNRRDFSLDPVGTTILDCIKASGMCVAAVGKIEDIFSGRSITDSVHTENNMDGVNKTLAYLDTINEGLIFTNLVDFDMLYGHRNDVIGYANALIEFDRCIPALLAKLREDDLLFITADHGCDPTTKSTDHSREYIPLLICGKRVKPGVNLHIRDSFSDIGATILDYLQVSGSICGESFLDEILNKKL